MDRRFLTVLGLSLVLALVVSLVFYQMVAGRTPTDNKAEATKDMVVAVKQLSIGSTVKAEDVKLVKVPPDQFPKGGFSRLEEVLDRPVASSLLPDEPIREGRLAIRGSGLGLATTIPVGLRAAAVRVSDVAGVAGYVLPGLRVDVLVTGQAPGSATVKTQTLLQNVLVLSAGQTMQPDARGNPIQTPTVTLLVTPEQAELLTLAQNQGQIQLVLRNSSDQTTSATNGSELSTVYRGGRPEPKPEPVESPRPRVTRPKPAPITPVSVAVSPTPPPPKPPAEPPGIIMIRGSQRTVELVPDKGNAPAVNEKGGN